MLVGQDPTVRKNPARVKQVLMLDQPQGQLSRWLRNLIGVRVFDQVTIYATNIVKCSFSKPPSDYDKGGLRFLLPYANNCREHLSREVARYAPNLVISLGEPSHNLFRKMLDRPDVICESMQDAFTGSFVQASIGSVLFDYTPCLHIQTFRVAETYGVQVDSFKRGLAQRLAQIT
jgi:uracil-DNA glycosylase